MNIFLCYSDRKFLQFIHISSCCIKTLKVLKFNLRQDKTQTTAEMSVRITTDQYRTLNGSIYVVHQSFSGFNTAELDRLHSPQLSLVV